MWGEGLLTRATRRVAVHAAGSGLERLADSIRNAGGAALEIVLPGGGRIGFGLKPTVVLTVKDDEALASFAAPTLGAMASSFVEGRIDVAGDMLEAIRLAERIAESASAPVTGRTALKLARHTPRQDRADISHHYDVGNEFYRLWLDERLVYSCAYFRSEETPLDDAQVAKLDHVCRKLRLSAGERFVDIGCGWGALALHAAQHYGVRAVGITLSENQWKLARERAAAAGLADRVEFLLLDYRELPQRFGESSFDKAASIGMFEHVGLNNLGIYFNTVQRVLRERGLFLNHGITSGDTENRPVGSGVSEFIGEYVFPNGELPHLHLAVREMSAHGFEITDVESLRPHYARTLEHWSRRLEQQSPQAAQCVDARTLRVWRAYLAGCAYGFTQGWMNIYQLLASRQTQPGPTELPLTRDWIYSA